MLFRLIRLHDAGVPIDKRLLGDAHVHSGNLVIDHWLEGSTFNMPVLRARLLSTAHGAAADVIAPLFNPCIVKMTNSQLTISGVEIVVHSGKSVHYSQSWLLKATSPYT